MPKYNRSPVLSFIAFLFVCILSVVFLVIGNKSCRYSPAGETQEDAETAIVVGNISARDESFTEGITNRIVTFEGKITSGEHKGEKVIMQQQIDGMRIPAPKQVAAGDKILILPSQEIDSENSAVEWHYAGTNRVPGMVWLIVLFLLMIVLIGRWKGVTTVVALIITVSSIFLVYIPSILSGKNTYASTIIVTLFIILSSLLILNGFNKKTLCAIVGNVGGILIAGGLALFINSAFGITGMLDEDYMFLTMLGGDFFIDLRAVIWGGILIGSLGAVMDVSMSIASAMQELSQQMHEKSFRRMVRSGMNIGRDAIGTMTNTLILAYTGGSLAIVLLFTAYNRDFLVVMNFEMIVVEVIQAIVGSIGILLAVPVTVFFAAWIFNKKEPLMPAEEQSL